MIPAFSECHFDFEKISSPEFPQFFLLRPRYAVAENLPFGTPHSSDK